MKKRSIQLSTVFLLAIAASGLGLFIRSLTSTSDPEIPIAESTVTYEIFIEQDADNLSDGTYVFTNDLGVEFEIDSMQLNPHSMQVVSCQNRIVDLPSFSKPVFADHSSDTTLELIRGTIAPLDFINGPTEATYEAGLEHSQYCEFHLAFGPDLSEDIPTLQLSGMYTLPGEEESNFFNVNSISAYGDSTPLEFTPADTNLVAVSFQMESLLDGIDTFDNPDDVNRQVLINAIEDMKVTYQAE